MKNNNHPRGKQDICFANIASPGGDFYFSQKRKRRNGKREESLPKNVFFYSFRVFVKDRKDLCGMYYRRAGIRRACFVRRYPCAFVSGSGA